jgi:hypothetical protein
MIKGYQFCFLLLLTSRVAMCGIGACNSLLSPTITGPDTACTINGGYVYTTEAGMTGYTWTISSGGNIISGSGSNSVTVLWIITGDQTISVTYNSIPDPTIKNVTVVSAGSAGITISASANPFCDTPVTFTATPSNAGSSPSYQWKVNCLDVGTNSPTFTYMPADGDYVSCMMISENTCVVSNPVMSNMITMHQASLTPSVSITVSANPVCEGIPVTFTAIPVNGGSSPNYLWHLNGCPVGASGQTWTHFPCNGDVVTCSMYSNSPCATTSAISNPIIMTVNQTCPASISIFTTTNPFCTGSLVTFTASTVNPGPSPVYQWVVNGINMGTNSPNFGYSPSNGDLVCCWLTSNAPCNTGPDNVQSNMLSMSESNSQAVSIWITASSNPCCQGQPLTCTATPFNAGSTPSYNWIINGMNAGTNSPIFSYMPSNGDVITCTLTSGGPCYSGSPANSNAITMTILPVLTVSITIVASSNPVMTGTLVTFTATAVNGGASPSFQWKVNGMDVGFNSPSYNYLPVNGDIVTCQLTSSLPCTTGNPATSNAINMSVNPLIQVSVSICASQNPVCAGTMVTFFATYMNGGPGPIYEWKVNCLTVGGNSSSYTYIPCPGDLIFCKLTSNGCCTNGVSALSNIISIKVGSTFPAGVGISVSGPCCQANQLIFTATTINSGISPLYQWKVNGISTGPNSPFFVYVPLCGDTISCQMTSSLACATNNPAISRIVMTNDISAGGSISGGSTIALGQNTGLLTLTGQTGVVLKWQRQLNLTGYSAIPLTNGLTVYSEVPSSKGTWDYRAAVQNGSCATIAYSLPASVTVIDGPLTRVWSGIQDNNWTAPQNWTPTGIPYAVDNILIPENASVLPTVKDTGLTCNNLYLFNDASLSIEQNKSLSITRDLLIGDFLSVPFSTDSPVIDGQIGIQEWQNANSYEVKFSRNDGNDSHTGKIYLLQDPSWLYIGIESNRNSGNNVYMQIRFDGNHDHLLSGNEPEPHTDLQVEYPSPGGDGQYNSYKYLKDNNSFDATEPAGSERASSGSINVTYEFKIKIADLNIPSSGIAGFYLKQGNDGIPVHDYEFLINKSANSAIQYTHIRF